MERAIAKFETTEPDGTRHTIVARQDFIAWHRSSDPEELHDAPGLISLVTTTGDEVQYVSKGRYLLLRRQASTVAELGPIELTSDDPAAV